MNSNCYLTLMIRYPKLEATIMLSAGDVNLLLSRIVLEHQQMETKEPCMALNKEAPKTPLHHSYQIVLSFMQVVISPKDYVSLVVGIRLKV